MTRNKGAGPTLSLIWLGLVAAAAVAAPLLWTESAARMDFAAVLAPPSAAHPLGTDPLGRDLLARLACGARVSVGVGVVAVGLSLLIGTFVGGAAGYFGGWRDRALMGLTDVMLCFPTLFLILAVIAVLGPGIWNVVLVIGATSWMGTARLVRAEVLSLREREFILAARAVGAGPIRILRTHLLPNALGPVLVSAVLGVATAVLLESGLSFLGLGVQPPTPSWGNLLTDGKATLGVAWWLTLFPGLVILLTALAANCIAEDLR